MVRFVAATASVLATLSAVVVAKPLPRIEFGGVLAEDSHHTVGRRDVATTCDNQVAMTYKLTLTTQTSTFSPSATENGITISGVGVSVQYWNLDGTIIWSLPTNHDEDLGNLMGDVTVGGDDDIGDSVEDDGFHEYRNDRGPYKTEIVPTINFAVNGQEFATSGRNFRVGAIFEGELRFPVDGDWTLCIKSDDGSMLFVDGDLVVDNNEGHSMKSMCGVVHVARKGMAKPVKVTFFDKAGNAGLVVSWGPSFYEQLPIPPGVWTTETEPLPPSCYRERGASCDVKIIAVPGSHVVLRSTSHDGWKYIITGDVGVGAIELSGNNLNSATPVWSLKSCVGECDHDYDCAPGLTCFQRDGFDHIPGCSGRGRYNWDYCTDPSSCEAGSECWLKISDDDMHTHALVRGDEDAIMGCPPPSDFDEVEKMEWLNQFDNDKEWKVDQEGRQMTRETTIDFGGNDLTHYPILLSYQVEGQCGEVGVKITVYHQDGDKYNNHILYSGNGQEITKRYEFNRNEENAVSSIVFEEKVTFVDNETCEIFVDANVHVRPRNLLLGVDDQGKENSFVKEIDLIKAGINFDWLQQAPQILVHTWILHRDCIVEEDPFTITVLFIDADKKVLGEVLVDDHEACVAGEWNPVSAILTNYGDNLRSVRFITPNVDTYDLQIGAKYLGVMSHHSALINNHDLYADPLTTGKPTQMRPFALHGRKTVVYDQSNGPCGLVDTRACTYMCRQGGQYSGIVGPYHTYTPSLPSVRCVHEVLEPTRRYRFVDHLIPFDDICACHGPEFEFHKDVEVKQGFGHGHDSFCMINENYKAFTGKRQILRESIPHTNLLDSPRHSQCEDLPRKTVEDKIIDSRRCLINIDSESKMVPKVISHQVYHPNCRSWANKVHEVIDSDENAALFDPKNGKLRDGTAHIVEQALPAPPPLVHMLKISLYTTHENKLTLITNETITMYATHFCNGNAGYYSSRFDGLDVQFITLEAITVYDSKSLVIDEWLSDDGSSSKRLKFASQVLNLPMNLLSKSVANYDDMEYMYTKQVEGRLGNSRGRFHKDTARAKTQVFPQEFRPSHLRVRLGDVELGGNGVDGAYPNSYMNYKPLIFLHAWIKPPKCTGATKFWVNLWPEIAINFYMARGTRDGGRPEKTKRLHRMIVEYKGVQPGEAKTGKGLHCMMEPKWLSVGAVVRLPEKDREVTEIYVGRIDGPEGTAVDDIYISVISADMKVDDDVLMKTQMRRFEEFSGDAIPVNTDCRAPKVLGNFHKDAGKLYRPHQGWKLVKKDCTEHEVGFDDRFWKKTWFKELEKVAEMFLFYGLSVLTAGTADAAAVALYLRILKGSFDFSVSMYRCGSHTEAGYCKKELLNYGAAQIRGMVSGQITGLYIEEPGLPQTIMNFAVNHVVAKWDQTMGEMIRGPHVLAYKDDWTWIQDIGAYKQFYDESHEVQKWINECPRNEVHDMDTGTCKPCKAGFRGMRCETPDSAPLTWNDYGTTDAQNAVCEYLKQAGQSEKDCLGWLHNQKCGFPICWCPAYFPLSDDGWCLFGTG